MDGYPRARFEQGADRTMSVLASGAFKLSFAIVLTASVVLAVRLNTPPVAEVPRAIQERPVEARVETPPSADGY